ncbi:hypothetical protein AGMMS49928_07110 [Spirochaetia bacterium]|nr:hypothetical protein AGMMS49928_07110 [Spirochaetia bacterium]
MNGIANVAVIDFIFGAVILLLTIRCFLHGFVDEAFSMASIVLGLLAAVFLNKNGAIFIRTKILADVQILPEIMAFIAIFLIVFLVIKIVRAILKDIIKRVNLGGVDRILGLFFGLLEGFVVVSLILFVLTIQPLFDPLPVLRGSLFAELLLPLISDSGELIRSLSAGAADV